MKNATREMVGGTTDEEKTAKGEIKTTDGDSHTKVSPQVLAQIAESLPLLDLQHTNLPAPQLPLQCPLPRSLQALQPTGTPRPLL